MSPEREVETRDRRRKGWFSIDDEVIERHGPKIGVHGIAVYAALCKHADKNERARVGLTGLCKKLRIGREKLLSTIDVLKDEGLIDVQPGDRAHASVYTLLHVEKGTIGGSGQNQERGQGGSNENHLSTEASSTENQGGSNENQIGGSDQNRNQTPIEPNPLPNPQGAAEAASKSGGKKDRSKPTPPDYRSKVESFLEANEDLADEVRDFIARAAAKNPSGEMTYSRQWRSFVSPVKDALAAGADPDAVLYALQEANRREARDIRYFESVLENNPNGKPRRGGPSGPGAPAGSSGPVQISGNEGAARRKEGYEDFFGEKPTEHERGEPHEPEPAPMPEPDPDAVEPWEEAMRRIAEEHDLDEGLLGVWFDGGVPASLGSDGSLAVVVRNSFAKEYVTSRFAETLEECSVSIHTPEEWAARDEERKAS